MNRYSIIINRGILLFFALALISIAENFCHVYGESFGHEKLDMQKMRIDARRKLDAGNLRQIGLALRMYAGDNQDRFPDDLAMIWEKEYLTASKVFLAPGSKTPEPKNAAEVRAGQCDYIYFGKGLSEADADKDIPLAVTRPGLLGGEFVNVLYGDGSVKGHQKPPPEVLERLPKLTNETKAGRP